MDRSLWRTTALVKGRVMAHWSAATNAGLGSATLVYQGGGAPPASEGIAHEIAGVTVELTHGVV